ncbi:MAG: hypothetical protein ACRDL0_11890, partial [Thermoleophilaceae bacterium]
MDRGSLRRLRDQPGYLPFFVSAATLARVSDEMFSVGVVLLVLDRTGSAVFTTAAGLKVGAFALGAALAGPVSTVLGSAEALLLAAAAQLAGRPWAWRWR